MLARVNQLFYVTVKIPAQFPLAAPSIHVMHRVVHDKISKDGKYVYLSDKLTNWGQHSNLLALIRHMHQEFELSPPLPEHMA